MDSSLPPRGSVGPALPENGLEAAGVDRVQRHEVDTSPTNRTVPLSRPERRGHGDPATVEETERRCLLGVSKTRPPNDHHGNETSRPLGLPADDEDGDLGIEGLGAQDRRRGPQAGGSARKDPDEPAPERVGGSDDGLDIVEIFCLLSKINSSILSNFQTQIVKMVNPYEKEIDPFQFFNPPTVEKVMVHEMDCFPARRQLCSCRPIKPIPIVIC
jgi:hypothetical protein